MGARKIEETINAGIEDLRDTVRSYFSKGYNHIVTITGIDVGENIRLLYHMANMEGDLVHIATETSKKSLKVPTIIDIIPGAYIYEMEVHDLFGVNFTVNPWMKFKLLLPDCYPSDMPPPLWKEVDAKKVQQSLFSIEGPACALKEPFSGVSQLSPESMVVPFGPYHPALKEPEHFRLIVEGERIVKAIPRIGFVHRGVEKAAESRSYLRDIFLLERICGICSFIHSWTFVQAVEKLLNLKPPRRAEWIRTMVSELERIHSHSLWLGLVGYWMGFDTMFMWIWGVRETIMDLLELLCGNRVHKSIVTIGGVRRDVTKEKLNTVIKQMKNFMKEFKQIMDEVLSYDEFIERTSNIGVFSAETARKLCTVGPIRRTIGDPYDIRKIEPYGAYEEIGFQVVTENKGDVYHAIRQRMREIYESARMIEVLAKEMPGGEAVPKRLFMGVVPEGEAVARGEAPRGELFYYVKSNNKHNPYRVKVRTPTLANITLASENLKGATLSDVPLVITAIDPCFSCMDRVAVYRRNTGEMFMLTEDDFRKLRRKWKP